MKNVKPWSNRLILKASHSPTTYLWARQEWEVLSVQLTLRYSKRRLPKKLKQNSLNKLIESSSLARDCIGGDAVKIKTNHLLIFLHNCFSKASDRLKRGHPMRYTRTYRLINLYIGRLKWTVSRTKRTGLIKIE